MAIKENVQAIIDTLQSALVDAEKFDNGNKTAGSRVRMSMQIVKAQAQTVRQSVSEIKNAEG